MCLKEKKVSDIVFINQKLLVFVLKISSDDVHTCMYVASTGVSPTAFHLSIVHINAILWSQLAIASRS